MMKFDPSTNSARCDRHAGDAYPTRCNDCEVEQQKAIATALAEAEASRASFLRGNR